MVSSIFFIDHIISSKGNNKINKSNDEHLETKMSNQSFHKDNAGFCQLGFWMILFSLTTNWIGLSYHLEFISKKKKINIINFCFLFFSNVRLTILNRLDARKTEKLYCCCWTYNSRKKMNPSSFHAYFSCLFFHCHFFLCSGS